jgi:hypothetical protein
VVVDEAHHTVATTYTTVLQALGFIEAVPMAEALAAARTHQQQDQSPWLLPDAPPDMCADASSRSSSSSSSSSVVDDSAADAAAMGSSDSDSEGGPSSSSSGVGAAGSRFVQRFRVLPNPNKLLLGFSATPFRMSKEESRQLYDMLPITYATDIQTMIRRNALCNVGARCSQRAHLSAWSLHGCHITCTRLRRLAWRDDSCATSLQCVCAVHALRAGGQLQDPDQHRPHRRKRWR